MLVTGPYCDGCIQQDIGVCRVEPYGTGANGILLVGDSPWNEEIAAKQVFSGGAGYTLDRILRRIGRQREDYLITNSMWCKPPYLGWTDHPERYPDAIQAIRHCAPYLDDLIASSRPRVIVVLGGVALRRICTVSGIEGHHSYVLPTSYGIPAIPTFHPSYIMQGKQELTPAVMFALRRAEEIAGGTYQPTPLELLLDPPIDVARAYLNRVAGRIPILMVDIETPESSRLDEEDLEEQGASYNIIRAGFSHIDNTGISFPWEQPYIDLMQEAMNRADILAEWTDSHFDSKRLRASGLRLPNRILSGMWAWHFYHSDLRKGLGFVAPFFYAGPPWKHLSAAEPAKYNAMDQAIGRAATIGSLDRLKAEGRLDRFMRHCVDVGPILVTMGKAGVPVDREYRDGVFFPRIRAEYDEAVAQLQSQVPDNVKPVKTWKRPPKDMTGVEVTTVDTGIKTLGGEPLMKPVLWSKRLPLNEDSRNQVIALMGRLNIKPPKVRGEGRETTEAKHLLRLSKKYPVFGTILRCRQRGKLISTYQWPLDEHGRVHTEYGFHSSTWRKTSRSVNLMNIPKRNDLAQAFRRTIVASPGHMLIEGDSSAIEAVFVGYDAGSPSYVRLSQAGIHGWMTSAYHKQVIPTDTEFDQLVKLCKAAKKQWPEDYEVLKRVDHLCLTGEHEVLTPVGWKRIDKLTNEHVAQWHNGEITFVQPSAYHQYQHEGEIVEVFGQAFSQVVTTNHALPVSINHTMKCKRVEVTQLTNNMYLPVTGTYSGGDIELTDVQTRLLACVQADGSIIGQTVRVRLKRPRKIERLRGLLAGLPHRVKKWEGSTVFFFKLALLGKAVEMLTISREFSDTVLRLTSHSRKVLLAELPLWDGSTATSHNYKRTVYVSKSLRSANIVQTLTHLSGAQALLRPTIVNNVTYYTVSFNRRQFVYTRPMKIARVPYSGQVYCITVASGFFIVRHRGRISVTGNSNYLGTPDRIFEEYPEEFESVAQAKKLQDFYFSTDPGKEVRRWQKAKMDRAHKETYLISHYGYKHYFYDVYTFDRRTYQRLRRFGKSDVTAREGAWKFGDDAKRAVAFTPQADASAFQTEVLLRLAAIEEILSYLRLIIHDSIVAEVPENRVEWVCQVLATEMTAPIPEMGGLSVGAEITIGRNLAKMTTGDTFNKEGKLIMVANPDGMQEWIHGRIAA